jgi:hypothetical protein
MQDLAIVVPFAGVGLAMIIVALAFSRQTTLSARRLDEQARQTRSFMMTPAAPPPIAKANAGTSGVTVHHPVHS